MAIHTTDYIVEWKPAGSWVDISAYIVEVQGAIEITGQRDNAFAFGDDSDLRCTIRVCPTLASPTLNMSVWEHVPIRYTTQVNAASAKAFTGVIVGQDGNLYTRDLACEGAKTNVTTSRAKMYSPPFYRRPVATATTLTSVEDPTSPSYRAGLINWIWWQAGGRPEAQKLSYPNASFYYHSDQAIIAPRWSFIGGDDGWQEALKLARASGGRIYQGGDGVVYYQQPLGFASGSASYTFAGTLAGATDSLGVYSEDVRFRAETNQMYTKVVCPYVPRSKRALQPVAEDTTVRDIAAGETDVEIIIEPSLPLADLDLTSGALKAEVITATFTDDGATVPQGGSGYTHTVDWVAMRVTITITNATSRPFTIWKIALDGYPIARGEPGSVTVGSGTIERTLEESTHVQSKEDAERLATLTLAFYDQSRLVYTINCPHDPRREVGETVGLTIPELGLSAVPCLILAIRHSVTGHRSEYDLVSVAGLPVDEEYFEIGTTDYSGQTRKLGY